MCLAAERERLERLGLSQDVVRTIQGARAASTRASYTAKWAAFQRWCLEKNLDPTTCPLTYVLSFLQTLVDRNLAFSTVKTYAAAVSSCHEGFGDRSVFSHPLLKRFLRGVRRTRPVSRSLAPQWDLALVLRTLIKAPFEPLDQVPLKFLSIKAALLLAHICKEGQRFICSFCGPIMPQNAGRWKLSCPTTESSFYT